jgi:hypothetical protein
MSVNRELAAKGFRQLLIVLFLVILSPITLNIAFKAIKKTEGSLLIPYTILFVSIVLIIITLVLAFRAFKILLDALFNK